MKFNDRVTGVIKAYDEKGRGVFDSVVVPFTAEGDEITGTLVKREKGKKILRLDTVNAPGADRVTAPCPHAGVCGGCLWQHLGYEAQLRLKLQMINGAFEKAGHEERVTDVMPSEDQFYYRNRMDYAVGWKGTIGLKEYGSWNRYLDLSTCLLLDKETPKILEIARELMRDLKLEPWDVKYHRGLFRYVVIRLGRNTNERLIMLVVSDLSRVTDETRVEITKRLSPFATSLLIGEQPLVTDLSYVKTVVALKGNPWLEEEVNGVRYRIAPNSFFQTNTKMAAKLQDVVVSHVEGSCILDLYCGLGFFGIHLGTRNSALRINGFEIDAEAIELAKHNAETNGVADRCTFTSGPAEDLSWKNIDADTIILDPPRAGLHPRVLETVLEKKPKTIVYVSCNYHRLVEELKKFKKQYHTESLHALDLFPHTPHVEVVAKLVYSTS